VERGTGRVRAGTMARITADNLTKVIEENVAHNATMMTDDYHLYKRVAEATGNKHFTTNHSKYEYVRGNVHSNTVEASSRCSSAASMASITTSAGAT
jgi:hypothetical protein